MTKTCKESASLEEKTYEELVCIRYYIEMIVRMLAEHLDEDYEMEKSGKAHTSHGEADAEAVYEKEVKEFGRGAHILVPKKWIGYNASIAIQPYLSEKGMFGGYIEKYPEKFGHLNKDAEKRLRKWKKEQAGKAGK